jgi:magnesium-transporting ATPase (P-type)
MRRPPRPRSVPLLTSGLLVRIAVAGGVTAVAALVLLIGVGGDGDHARWVAFSALVFGQLVRAYTNRSLVHPLRRLPANGFLAIACLCGAAFQLAIPYVPPLAEAFRASSLDGPELLLVALIAVGPALVGEVVRSIRGSVWVA